MNPEPECSPKKSARLRASFYWRSKWMESNRAKANGRSLCATAVEIPSTFITAIVCCISPSMICAPWGWRCRAWRTASSDLTRKSRKDRCTSHGAGRCRHRQGGDCHDTAPDLFFNLARSHHRADFVLGKTEVARGTSRNFDARRAG